MDLEKRVADLEDKMVTQNLKNGKLVSMIDDLELRVKKLEPPAIGGRRNRSLRKRERRRRSSRKH